MTLPIWTTTISILRTAPQDDAYPDAEREFTAVQTGIHANIAVNPRLAQPPSAAAGQRSAVQARLTCDPCDLQHLDVVLNELTDEQWRVDWVASTTGALPHTVAAVTKWTSEVEATEATV